MIWTGTITIMEPVRAEERMPGFLEGVTRQQVVRSNDLLGRYYKPLGPVHRNFKHDVKLRLLVLSETEPYHRSSTFPVSYVRFSSAGQEIFFPSTDYKRMVGIQPRWVRNQIPMLFLDQLRVRPGRNDSYGYLISLSPSCMNKLLGPIMAVGEDDLFGRNDLFIHERVPGWLQDLPEPPEIRRFWRVENCELVRAERREQRYYQDRFGELMDQIYRYPDRVEDVAETVSYLRMVYEKFYVQYRVLGERNAAWANLKRDLRKYDDRRFFIKNDQGINSLIVNDLVQRIRDGLKSTTSRTPSMLEDPNFEPLITNRR
jgi:hypothetical protein